MLACLLLSLQLTALPAAQTATVTTSTHVAPDGEQGIRRGVRNMVIGGLVSAAGIGVSIASTLVIGAGVVAGLAVGQVLGHETGQQIFALSLLGFSAVFFAGATLLVGGIIWLGVNGMLVLMRMSPDYKPSPATEYLDM